MLILILLPLVLDLFRLNLVGKYLTYAFVAVGLVLCWDNGNPQPGAGQFFGLGGYCMAAFLKLEASSNIAQDKDPDPSPRLVSRILWIGIRLRHFRTSGIRSDACR